MASGDLSVEVLEQPNPGVAALVGAGRVARELEEVEPVGDPKGPGEVGDEDEARLQRRYQKRLPAIVVAPELAPELADARLQLLPGEVDLAEAAAAA
jgi:hypothetical protein